MSQSDAIENLNSCIIQTVAQSEIPCSTNSYMPYESVFLVMWNFSFHKFSLFRYEPLSSGYKGDIAVLLF